MAFLRISDGRFKNGYCGGFLVWSDIVLTAAHCYCKQCNISVVLGAHNVQKTEAEQQSVHVSRCIIHPKYNNTTLENDIMLLQLRHEAKWTQAVGILPLAHKSVKKGAVCSVAGWGATSTQEGAPSSPVLREVALPVVGDDLCSRRYKYYNRSLMICAGNSKEKKDSWKGDSGGALVCDGEAQGIVSFGTKPPPGAYTKVPEYIDWIHKTLETLDS
uniref:Peptidase S1 domain-containing protein n=1 Tax=Sphenodon punctatus TaxID=8508 RepID=A0A8D0H9C0_SPHPU